MGIQERGRILHKFADLIEKHLDELSELETLVCCWLVNRVERLHRLNMVYVCFDVSQMN